MFSWPLRWTPVSIWLGEEHTGQRWRQMWALGVSQWIHTGSVCTEQSSMHASGAGIPADSSSRHTGCNTQGHVTGCVINTYSPQTCMEDQLSRAAKISPDRAPATRWNSTVHNFISTLLSSLCNSCSRVANLFWTGKLFFFCSVQEE